MGAVGAVRTDREIFMEFLEKVSNISNAHTNTDLVIAAAEALDEMSAATAEQAVAA